jgi:fluoroquinolone transport system permease protein
MNKLIRITVNDFRLVFRDNSLKIFIALPLLTLLAVKYGVPYLVSVYGGLQEYVAFILMLATTQGSVAFGFIYSMVLVDEKDKNVASVYGILPVSKSLLIIFRLIPPFLLSTLATFLLLLVEPFYGLPIFANLAYSTLTGLVAPTMALFVVTAATNKIEAMTWQKLFNLPLTLPILAFFVPAPVAVLFAIFPTYWAYQAMGSLINGDASFWVYLSIGILYSVLVLVILIERFVKRHFK